jgi:hypothetical protein
MPTCVTPSSLSQSRSASRSRVRVEKLRLSRRGLLAAGLPDQHTDDHRGLMDVETGAAFDDGFHDPLLRAGGDRNAAGRRQKLPHVLTHKTGRDIRRCLKTARVRLTYGITSPR